MGNGENNAKQLSEKLVDGIMDGFPNFIVFCIGDNGGFCLMNTTDKKGGIYLDVQIESSFRHHPELMESFEEIIRRIKNTN